jgi:hypothetical protein
MPDPGLKKELDPGSGTCGLVSALYEINGFDLILRGINLPRRKLGILVAQNALAL